MNFDYSLSLKLIFKKKENAEKILLVLKPEMQRKYNRSKFVLKSCEKELVLTIQAVDLTALRASFNTTMKNIILSNELIHT